MYAVFPQITRALEQNMNGIVIVYACFFVGVAIAGGIAQALGWKTDFLGADFFTFLCGWLAACAFNAWGKTEPKRPQTHFPPGNEIPIERRDAKIRGN